jgi:hypothetical protein
MKEFTVKENDAFRLRVKTWKCLAPEALNTIEFIQESKDKNGNVDLSSVYQFFMTDDEMKTLAQGLTA